jgi:diadenosine tetraphosphate (Ap4A) HIT family hydrolase
MSQIRNDPKCPLCWANGKLAGGRVLAETSDMFAYVFTDEAGGLKYALIIPKEHHADMASLPSYWGDEFGVLYTAVLSLMSDQQPHNGYWNAGYAAGQRVMGHWHVRVEPRQAGQPASDMGLNLLLTKYNTVTERLARIAEQCTDAATTAELHKLLAL